MMNEQKKLLKLIQNYSFVVTETVLYLDTHPNCRAALRHYHKYRKLYKDAVACYEEKYGPLTMYTNESADCWKWVSEPWPWEL
ncbi:MAG: spore coat protein CotJB [Clostridia bacterium]|nr:spore coat protein CotJB [Clostridia bacterium]